MIDIKNLFQASIFVNAEDITPSPDVMTDLIGLFKDKGFIPTTFQAVNLAVGSAQLRVRLMTPNNEWNVSFAANRIDVTKLAIDYKGSNLGELDVFCTEASNLFERIINKYHKRANRLSFNSNFLLEEMTSNRLSEIYYKLFKPFDFYKENIPFEWNWRTASRISHTIDNLTDVLNIITLINRMRGEIILRDMPTVIDRLQLSFDINTTDLNVDYRFELSHMKYFFENAPKIHETLCRQIEDCIK